MACPGVSPRHYPLQTLHSLSPRAPPVFAQPEHSQGVLHLIAKVRRGSPSTWLCLAMSLCCDKVFWSCLTQSQLCAWSLYITFACSQSETLCTCLYVCVYVHMYMHVCEVCMCKWTCTCVYVKALVAIPRVLNLLFSIQGLSLVWSVQSLASWWVAGTYLPSAPAPA